MRESKRAKGGFSKGGTVGKDQQPPEETMGDVKASTRRVAMTVRCAWCSQIKLGQVWADERREPSKVLYSHGICKKCLGLHVLARKCG